MARSGLFSTVSGGWYRVVCWLTKYEMEPAVLGISPFLNGEMPFATVKGDFVLALLCGAMGLDIQKNSP